MDTPGLHDIEIGHDRWIEAFDVLGRLEGATEIDFLIEPIRPFWNKLATNCDPGCCGIDAFGLYPAEIGRASQVLNGDDLQTALNALLIFVKQSPAEVFVSRILNNYFDRRTLIPLIEHIAYNIDGPRWAFEKETTASREKPDYFT